jgi:Phosphotransferase enzyme family
MERIAPQFSGPMSHVIRIGQTVHRPVHRNTAMVQALLKHLEQVGFDEAPRALGFDEEGREMVSYTSGMAGHYPLKSYVLSESTLLRIGLLLRRFHDATIGFSLPKHLVWQNTVSETSEVICHGDAGPYNIIFRNGAPVGLIDFERATPGPRVWISHLSFTGLRLSVICESKHSRHPF